LICNFKNDNRVDDSSNRGLLSLPRFAAQIMSSLNSLFHQEIDGSFIGCVTNPDASG
jgi:hypothetical protein